MDGRSFKMSFDDDTHTVRLTFAIRTWNKEAYLRTYPVFSDVNCQQALRKEKFLKSLADDKDEYLSLSEAVFDETHFFREYKQFRKPIARMVSIRLRCGEDLSAVEKIRHKTACLHTKRSN